MTTTMEYLQVDRSSDKPTILDYVPGPPHECINKTNGSRCDICFREVPMTETKYIRLCQATLLDKNEKCITRLQLAEDACTDTLTPKERFLSGKYADEYTCNMCKGQHLFSEAMFAYQKHLFWDKTENPDQPMTFFEPYGKDEFRIKGVFKNEDLLKDPIDQTNQLKRVSP